MTFECEFPVRFGEIDNAGVVYYPRFFHIFHMAFEEWFGGALGATYADLVVRDNIGFPSVKVETEFLAPLRYGESVRVRLELEEIGRKSITCRYTMFRLPDGVEAARARITTVAIDNDSFKSITIPDEWRERLQRFKDSE